MPLRLIFMGMGVAEVHQEPIAQVLRHIAIKVLYNGGGGFLVGTHDGAVIFGVKLAGERCRLDEIAEQHRDVPPFGLDRIGYHLGLRHLGRLGVLLGER